MESFAWLSEPGATGWDLILIVGGVFLIGKSTREIHNKLEAKAHGEHAAQAASFASVITQFPLLDLVFSLASVITAVGMADRVEVMMTAVIIAVIVMTVPTGRISLFIEILNLRMRKKQ